MQDLGKGMGMLASQLDELKVIPKLNKLRTTISEFPIMMREVVDFIEKWLESWSGVYSIVWDILTTESLVTAKHILVLPHKDKAIELRRNMDEFWKRFMVEARIGLVFAYIYYSTCLNCDFSRYWCFERFECSRWVVCSSSSAF